MAAQSARMTAHKPSVWHRRVPTLASIVVIVGLLIFIAFLYDKLWKPRYGLEMTPKLQTQLEQWKKEFIARGGPPGGGRLGPIMQQIIKYGKVVDKDAYRRWQEEGGPMHSASPPMQQTPQKQGPNQPR